MNKTNFLFLIIGFLAGFAIGVPVLAYLMKSTVAFIARHVAARAIDDLQALALLKINETTSSAKIALSEAHSGITKSAAETFDYLSKLITPESINTAYGLNEPPVGCSLNVPNKTRALAAALVKEHQNKSANYRPQESLTFEWLEKEKSEKPSDAPDTFNLRLSAVDRVNKDIFDGEIVSGDEFSMNLTASADYGSGLFDDEAEQAFYDEQAAREKARQDEIEAREKQEQEFAKGNRQPITEILSDIYDEGNDGKSNH